MNTPQPGGGSTPGATTKQLLIQQGIFDYNMNTTAAGMDENRAMNEAVAYFEALIDTTVQERLLALPSMADEPEVQSLLDNNSPPYIDNPIAVKRNELRATLRAEIKGGRK